MALGVERDGRGQEGDPYHARNLHFFLPGKRAVEQIPRKHAEKCTCNQDYSVSYTHLIVADSSCTALACSVAPCASACAPLDTCAEPAAT